MKGILAYASIWMSQEDIMLSKIRHSKERKKRTTEDLCKFADVGESYTHSLLMKPPIGVCWKAVRWREIESRVLRI